MEILRECHGLYQYYNKTWNSYLNFCLLKIVVLLSNHENHLQTIFLPKNIAYLLSYAFLFIAIANSTVFNLKLTVSCAMILKCFQFSQYVRKVFILLKIFIIRKMNTKYFHGFVIKINTFHATECHLNPIQDPNTRNFTFCLIRF